MQPTIDTQQEFRSVLDSAKTIAVVGCSDRPDRVSYAIARYLDSAGYEVIPVNPNHDACAGKVCYPDLLSVPEDHHIDIVDIFRDPRYTADMVEIAVQRAEKPGEHPVIWTQLGVSSVEAERIANEAGLPYVKDRCIMVEHRRLLR